MFYDSVEHDIKDIADNGEHDINAIIENGEQSTHVIPCMRQPVLQ